MSKTYFPKGYNVASLCNKIEERKTILTAEQLVALIKKAGQKNMVVVTTKMGTTLTHVQRSKTTKRFSGLTVDNSYVTFYPDNVRSFKLVPAVALPATFEKSDPDLEFRYF